MPAFDTWKNSEAVGQYWLTKARRLSRQSAALLKQELINSLQSSPGMARVVEAAANLSLPPSSPESFPEPTSQQEEEQQQEEEKVTWWRRLHSAAVMQHMMKMEIKRRIMAKHILQDDMF